MLEFEELRLKLESYKDELLALKEAIGYEQLKEQVEKLESQAAADGFWDDIENSQKVLQQTSRYKSKIQDYDRLCSLYEDAGVLILMGDEAEDLSLVDEAAEYINNFITDLSSQRLATLLTGEYDANSAILTFHAGAGGTEAQDWNEMLVRMYTKWAEPKGYKVSMLDFLDGEEAGLKSAVLRIEGENAYGFLKSEAGVHRLVRISPFDSSGRRHTSFASLDVMPEIDGNVEVEIRSEDLRLTPTVQAVRAVST